VIFLALSFYERAYLEIKRIIIQHPIINEKQLIDEDKIDILHERVKQRIQKKPELKEKIWNGANRTLLKYIEKSLATVKPSPPYDYMDLVDYLRENYDLKTARLLSRAILRLDKYLDKHYNYFYSQRINF